MVMIEHNLIYNTPIYKPLQIVFLNIYTSQNQYINVTSYAWGRWWLRQKLHPVKIMMVNIVPV